MSGSTRRLGPWQVTFDVALAAALAGLGLAEVWLPFESVFGDGSPVHSTIAILVASVFVALRRLWAVGLAGVFLTWFLLGFVTRGDILLLFNGQVVPFMVALYSAARHGRGRTPWVVAGVAAVTLLFADTFVAEAQGLDEVVFHWTVCALAFAIGSGLRASEQRAVTAALQAREAAELAEQQAEAAFREERVRIARELHDILAHTVSVMVVQAGAAQQLVERDAGAAREALDRVLATGNDALEEVRGLVTLMRADEDPARAPQPGLEALDELVEAVRTPTLSVDVAVEGEVARVPPGLSLAAYRIVQESLTNVRKHSDASTATVRVSAGASLLTVEVTDDGTPGAPAGSAGNGLIGMRERVAMYGGRFEAGPTGSGYGVRAELPRSGPT